MARGLEVSMEWWIIGALGVAVVILIAIDRVSLRENRQLANYCLLLLLENEIYEIQKRKLVEFVGKDDSKRAIDLAVKVYIAIGRMAMSFTESGLLVAGLLWDVKQGKPKSIG